MQIFGSRALGLPPGPFRINWTTIALTALTLAVGFAVIGPALILFRTSFSVPVSDPALKDVAFGFAGWAKAASDPGVRSAFINTLLLTITYQGISLPIGILVAWLIGRTDLPARDWLEFGFWVSFFLPPLSVVQGWILLLDPKYGIMNVGMISLFGFERSPFNIYSWWGIVFAHLATTSISVKVMLMTPAFRNMDSSLEEAARMSGDSTMKTMVKIVVPLMAPAILAIAVMGVVRALEAFEIELVLGSPLGINVYSTKIYELVRRESADYTTAATLGVMIMLLMVSLTLLPRWLTRGKSYSVMSGKNKMAVVSLGGWRWPAFAVVFAMVMMLTVVPVTFLGMGSFMTMFGFFSIAKVWTLNHYHDVFGDPVFFESLINTLILAGGTAVFAVVVSTILAYVIVRTMFYGRTALDAMSWIPFTMPGVLFSLAILWLVLENAALKPLYGTTLLLVLTIGLGSLTVGTQIIKSNFVQLGGDMETASWISGASWLKTLFKIVIPLSIRSIAVVGIIGFIAAARNISHLALLVSSDNRPLAILQLEYLVEGRYEAASIVGLIVVVVTVGVAFAARQFGFSLGAQQQAPSK